MEFERQLGLVPEEEKEEKEEKSETKPTDMHLQLLHLSKEISSHVKEEQQRPTPFLPASPRSYSPQKQKNVKERRRKQAIARAKEFKAFFKQEKRLPSKSSKSASADEKMLANWFGKQKYYEKMGTRASNEEVDRILIEIL